jgi:CheY-like chemotaxis protein
MTPIYTDLSLNRDVHEPPSYILMIDDDEDDLEMFSSGLIQKGFKVKVCTSSAKALFYLKLMSGTREFPSLIIMDYNMPMKNGYQVLLLLKENRETRDIPVVLYSTSMSVSLKELLSAAGALGSFSKPWNYEEFTTQVEMIQELLYAQA